MKELEIFYLTSCPYCINARKAIDELTAENPAYAGKTTSSVPSSSSARHSKPTLEEWSNEELRMK